MKINPQTFFSFCERHTTLLRALAGKGGEISEAEAFRMIRTNPGTGEEMPETTWRRLRELQILVPSEPGSESFFLAEPVARLLSYLYNEANPATPEIIKGYVLSLETANKRLSQALESEHMHLVQVTMEEISQTLWRIYADMEETQKAILAEVSRYKTERSRVPVREKYRRIVYWMERYVEPMIEIVRADGPLRAAFDETEKLLYRTQDEVPFSNQPWLNRNRRLLRLLASHALRIFTQCRKEIQPLYESLRRSSFIAEGAARALEKLQNEGIAKWGPEHLIGVTIFRHQSVPGDAAIALALRRAKEHPPEAPPVLALTSEKDDSGALKKLLWIESLPGRIKADLPVPDLLAWLVDKNPDSNTSDVLSGFSGLVFHQDFRSSFADAPPRDYVAADGIITASPLKVTAV